MKKIKGVKKIDGIYYKRLTWNSESKGNRVDIQFPLSTKDEQISNHEIQYRVTRLVQQYKPILIRIYEDGGSRTIREFKNKIDWLNEDVIDIDTKYSINQSIKDYEADCKSNAIKKGTLAGYLFKVNWFGKTIGFSHPVSRIKKKHITFFKQSMLQGKNGRPYSKHYLNSVLRGLRTYLNWLYDEGKIKEVPKIKMFSVPKCSPRYYTNEEFELIMDNIHCINESVDDLMIRTYRMYRETGLRLFEPFENELESDRLKIHGSSTKNSYKRNVYLTEQQVMLIIELRAFIDEKVKKGKSEEGAVKNISRAFKSALKNAKIPYGKFHNIRDTFATRLYYLTDDIAKVSDRLGHTGFDMTRKYTKFDEVELMDAFPDICELKLKKSPELELKNGSNFVGVNLYGNFGYLNKSV